MPSPDAHHAALLRIHLAQDTVLDPVLIPPLDGIHLDAIDLHGEVQVISSGETRGTALAERLALFHHVAGFDGELTEMAVNGLQAIAVVNHHTVAVDAQIV